MLPALTAGPSGPGKKELQMFSASVSWLSWILVGFSDEAEDFPVVWAKIIITIQFCTQKFVCSMFFVALEVKPHSTSCYY